MVLWFTGLSGSGKTTIANLLTDHLESIVLDGDEMRKGICSNLGFSNDDRAESIRRIAHVAKILNEDDPDRVVIVATISPLDRHREIAKSILGDSMKIVYVNCPLETCILRDPKGLYERNTPIMTGISSPYEPPGSPDLIVSSGTDGPADCVGSILNYVLEQNDL